jgi:hypothetical protein
MGGAARGAAFPNYYGGAAAMPSMYGGAAYGGAAATSMYGAGAGAAGATSSTTGYAPSAYGGMVSTTSQPAATSSSSSRTYQGGMCVCVCVCVIGCRVFLSVHFFLRSVIVCSSVCFRTCALHWFVDVRSVCVPVGLFFSLCGVHPCTHFFQCFP